MKYFLPFFLCVLLASCFNEGDCLISATNYMRIQFKKRKNTSQDTLVSFAYKAIEVVGQGFIVKVPATSQILLPLNVTQDSSSTTFIFHRIISSSDTTIQAIDTVRIGYTKQAKVISKDCGAYNYYQDLTVKKLNTNKDTIAIKAFNKSLLKDPTGSPTSATSYALNYQILY